MYPEQSLCRRDQVKCPQRADTSSPRSRESPVESDRQRTSCMYRCPYSWGRNASKDTLTGPFRSLEHPDRSDLRP